MIVDTRDLIWKAGILPAIKDVREQIPNDVWDKYHVKQLPDSLLKAAIFQSYDEGRQYIRSHFFDVGKDNDKLIDFHKVCACIVFGLINNRVFEFDIVSGIEEVLLRSNYEVAFWGGVKCQFLFSVAKLFGEGRQDVARKLWKLREFRFPQTNIGHDGYALGRIKSLALNDIYQRDFDFLAYADMLFWIEKYNIDLLT